MSAAPAVPLVVPGDVQRGGGHRATASLPATAAAAALVLLVGIAVQLPAASTTGVKAALTAAACSAAVAAVVAGYARRRPVAAAVAAPVTAALVLLVTANATAAQILLPDAAAAPVAALALVASGLLVLAQHWLVVTVVSVWVLWCVPAVVAQTAPLPAAVLGMVLATGLGVTAHLLRRKDVIDLDGARAHARSVTVLDELTGVANRSGLVMMGEQILEAARRQGDAVHCVVIDLEGMRRVNEGLGRAGGDQVLIAVADAVRAATRATDVVARWRDDRFVVVGPGQGTPAAELERRVGERLTTFPTAATWPRVDAGGAMLAPWDAGSLDSLLGWAVQEMLLRRTMRRHASGAGPAAPLLPPGGPGLGMDPSGSSGASETH